MVSWQVTATTVRCDSVNDEVTLLVYKDWSVKCTGYVKYASKNGRSAVRGLGRRCEGTDCETASGYRRKLRAEEGLEN